jgi:hypothetical protein
MRLLERFDKSYWGKDLAGLILGTAGGLAAGILLSRAFPGFAEADGVQRRFTGGIASRVRPARVRTGGIVPEEFDRLEQAVLDEFLADATLRERGIDIAVISSGIVELAGSVWTEAEATRAVELVNRIVGVRTVVNRIEVEERMRRAALRKPFMRAEPSSTFEHLSSRTGGMGRHRQGSATEPPQRDDSQRLREGSLAAADRAQWSDEDLGGSSASLAGRGSRAANPTNFSEDELDNQDPHGKHTRQTLDSPPQELNSRARVGEGLPPGIERALERDRQSMRDPGR